LLKLIFNAGNKRQAACICGIYPPVAKKKKTPSFAILLSKFIYVEKLQVLARCFNSEGEDIEGPIQLHKGYYCSPGSICQRVGVPS
jgi:hypothetical protein